MSPQRALAEQSGFTIIEVVVAAFILLIGVLATLALFDRANAATVIDRHREAATSLAREFTEGARSVPFDGLVGVAALNTELQKMPGLEDDTAGGAPYTVMRRGTAFTVVTEVCTMDDGKDGGGKRPSGLSFCADSTTAGTADLNPEDYRRVTATVSWRDRDTTRSVRQAAIINNPGSGPGIDSIVPALVPPPGISAYEITSDEEYLTVKITTSSPSKTVSWSLDGTAQATTATKSDPTGLAWQVDWPIKWLAGGAYVRLADGAYVITADAFDENDASGPSRSETIILNRLPAKVPTGFAGGRNGFGGVDLEWSANTERDIIGYEVERTDATGAKTIVCSFVQQKLDTTCTDPTPPDGSLSYRVRAYDRFPGTATAPGTGAARPGAWSDPHQVVTTNEAPFAPTSLTLSTPSAVVTLTIGRPTPEDPDSGDSIAFFRIYRDGKGIANRYDRWYGSGSSVTWQDIRTGGLPHDYYVTAVDTHYGESPMIGPVRGG